MTREDARSKASRLLVEGRVIVTAVDGPRVSAVVRGEGAIYRVTAVHDEWTCPCPARTRCSHVLAVMRVTAPARPTPGAP